MYKPWQSLQYSQQYGHLQRQIPAAQNPQIPFQSQLPPEFSCPPPKSFQRSSHQTQHSLQQSRQNSPQHLPQHVPYQYLYLQSHQQPQWVYQHNGYPPHPYYNPHQQQQSNWNNNQTELSSYGSSKSHGVGFAVGMASNPPISNLSTQSMAMSSPAHQLTPIPNQGYQYPRPKFQYRPPPAYNPPQKPTPHHRNDTHYSNSCRPRNPNDNVEECSNFACEACEKTFRTHHQLQAHLNTHVKCPECSFSGSGRVVSLHQEEKHGLVKPDGKLSEAIVMLDTPEKIAKWREERKKNYPTAANIAKKKQKEQKRLDRGELPLDPKRKGNFGTDHKFDKRQKFENSSGSSSQTQKEQPSGALEILAAYNDSDSDMDPQRDSISSKHPSASLSGNDNSPNDSKNCKFWRKGKCKKGDACAFRHDPRIKQIFQSRAFSEIKSVPSVGQFKNRTSISRQHKPKNILLRRTPLLRALLEKEIRIERSQILQCIRFIVKNDFFEKGLTYNGKSDNERPPTSDSHLAATLFPDEAINDLINDKMVGSSAFDAQEGDGDYGDTSESESQNETSDDNDAEVSSELGQEVGEEYSAPLIDPKEGDDGIIPILED